MPRTRNANAALANAKSGADVARALNVNPKTFRAWLRRQGVRLAKGGTIDAALKAKAQAKFAAPKA